MNITIKFGILATIICLGITSCNSNESGNRRIVLNSMDVHPIELMDHNKALNAHLISSDSSYHSIRRYTQEIVDQLEAVKKHAARLAVDSEESISSYRPVSIKGIYYPRTFTKKDLKAPMALSELVMHCAQLLDKHPQTRGELVGILKTLSQESAEVDNRDWYQEQFKDLDLFEAMELLEVAQRRVLLEEQYYMIQQLTID